MRYSVPSSSRSIIETILVLLLFLALLIALYDVLKVFFGVFTFALIFFASFNQFYEWLCKLLHQRRKLAAILYTVVLLIIVAIPFAYIITALGKHMKDLLHFIAAINEHGVPPLPEQVTTLPVIGDPVATFWQQLQENPKETLTGHEHQLKIVLHHILTGGAGIIGVSLQVILGIIISALLLAGGNKILDPLKLTLQHLLGKRDSLTLLNATYNAIRGVSIGVMGTAFIAAVISWIGFAIAGIHFKVLFCALVFFCVLIQVGPLVVWIPMMIWAAVQGHTGTTVFVIAYGLFVLGIDTVLKPILISKSGKKLPFLVLFIGVIGGMAAWGFTGMFKGAIILSVFYTIFNSWLERKKGDSPAELSPSL
ncbi:AI-2E family transporter [Chitinophaga ginsengisegetis]|uniref:AI-2E family transporter n=1 Tax=Chitinophaga ginsengisegetis TaxID=393003 RepID=UPI0034399216